MLPSVRNTLRLTCLALGLLTTTAATPARAGDCGDVDAMGQCLDAQTLVWCAEGKLKQATCPKGEICAAHQTFNGGVGCLPPAKTSCGDVPTEGQCTSAGAVAWCDDRGEVQVQSCGQDAVCGWDAEQGWYDCLPMGGPPRRALPDAGSPADAAGSSDADAPDAAGADEDSPPDGATTDEAPEPGPDAERIDAPTGPTPPVVSGAGSAEAEAGAAEGCAGGAPGAPPLGWLAALLLVSGAAARRRRLGPCGDAVSR
ncbi:MAG: hypothetical protein H6744_02775 [Deltaproteobacteria bacterium]|nr:hypothetical protein [Deltaproteobacteria bacterium]